MDGGTFGADGDVKGSGDGAGFYRPGEADTGYGACGAKYRE